MVSNNIKQLEQQCRKYYLLATAGIMAVPTNMAQQARTLYQEHYNQVTEALKRGITNVHEFIDPITIDMSELPDQYQPDKLEQIAKDMAKSNHINVKYIFQPSQKSGVEGWSLNQKLTITIKTHIDINNPVIDLVRATDVIEHELIHYIQLLLLRKREQIGYKSTEDSLAPSFHSEQIFHKTVEELQSNPDFNSLSSKEKKLIIHAISPQEFHPKLNGARDRFLSGKGESKGTFKQFVGLAGKRTDFFFAVLKKWAPRLWIKAVKELWKQVEDIVYYK